MDVALHSFNAVAERRSALAQTGTVFCRHPPTHNYPRGGTREDEREEEDIEAGQPCAR